MATCAGAQVVPQGFLRSHAPVPLAIGDNYQGGIIAYILQSGDPGWVSGETRGLIAATADMGITGVEWGCFGTPISGADGTLIGTGNQNTVDIMAGCATAGIAARLCGDLVLNGYSDWYLPSKDELLQLYLNKLAIGGFTSNSYWSSSEFNSDRAHYLYFPNGGQATSTKNFTYYVRAVRAFPTLPTITTTAVAPIATTTATSGGNVTNQGDMAVTARGVCWSTTTGPTVALSTKTTDGTGTGTFPSSIIGLTASTLYYVRAYATSSAGTAYGNQVSFTTAAPFACGTSTLTISHLASGGVAPVIKTVTYGTVSTMLFGGTKCAITQNLGADHQANAVDDDSEASAGWYWQFNRKQGYKHDGATLTPSWAETPFNETSDWVAANDPCTLELGTGWRIPTNAEWTTANGSWTTWTHPFSSALKLHAAGYLWYSNGWPGDRGLGGYYWSSAQNDATNGWYLYFNSSYSGMESGGFKPFGFSARCVRD